MISERFRLDVEIEIVAKTLARLRAKLGVAGLRCIEPCSLRPWAALLRFFTFLLCFGGLTSLDELSLFELSSGCVCPSFAPVSAGCAGLAAGLLLGSELLLVAVLDELPGSALLF